MKKGRDPAVPRDIQEQIRGMPLEQLRVLKTRILIYKHIKSNWNFYSIIATVVLFFAVIYFHNTIYGIHSDDWLIIGAGLIVLGARVYSWRRYMQERREILTAHWVTPTQPRKLV